MLIALVAVPLALALCKISWLPPSRWHPLTGEKGPPTWNFEGSSDPEAKSDGTRMNHDAMNRW